MNANARPVRPFADLPHLAPVRIGNGRSVHLGHKVGANYGQPYVSNGCAAGIRSHRAASAAGKLQPITVVDEDIDCAACLKDVIGASGARPSAAAEVNTGRARAARDARLVAIRETRLAAATPVAARPARRTGLALAQYMYALHTQRAQESTDWRAAHTARASHYAAQVALANGDTQAIARPAARPAAQVATVPAAAAATPAARTATIAQEAPDMIAAPAAPDAAEVAQAIADMVSDGILPRRAGTRPAPAAPVSFREQYRATHAGNGKSRDALGTPVHTLARDALQAFNAQEWDVARRIIARAMAVGMADPADITWAQMLATVDAAQERAEGTDALAAAGDGGAATAAALAQYAAPAAQVTRADYDALAQVDADALATAYAVVSEIDAAESVKILDAMGAQERAVAAIDAAPAADARTVAQERAAVRRAQEARDIDEALEGRYEMAEAFTRGHLLSPVGKAQGIDARTLFTGPSNRVAAYASEELQEFFAANGRMTRGDYRRAMAGERAAVRVTIGHDAADVAAAQAGAVVTDATDVDGAHLGDNARGVTLTRKMRGSALKPARRALAAAHRDMGVVFSVTGGGVTASGEPCAVVTATAGAELVNWARVAQVITDALAADVATADA